MNHLLQILIFTLSFSTFAIAADNWQTQQLTLSDYFTEMTKRSMALDMKLLMKAQGEAVQYHLSNVYGK